MSTSPNSDEVFGLPENRGTNGGELLGHPKGLFVLFFAEMWERFSFYGMRGMLFLYMWKSLQYAEEHAHETYGAYIGFVYATPLIGGMLADRFLGARKAIMLGGMLMVMGHLAMAFEFPIFFYGAMALIVCGNGFFKPNISTIVGTLYAKDDPRRDSAFTIFYMGINLGAGLAPILCGTLGEKVAWHWGFTLAGVGMVFGLIVFAWGQRYLGDHGLPPRPEAFKEPLFAGLPKLWALYIGIILFVPVAAYLLYNPSYVETGVIMVLGPIVLVYIIIQILLCKPGERGRLATILVLIFFSITFWSCFEQAGSSMTQFADTQVDRVVFGWEIPTTWFQSVNPLFILVFAPVFSWLWLKLERARKDPSSPMKFALGIFQLAAGFVMLVIGAKQAASGGQSSLIWLILAYLLHTTGELCLSPVGLSTVTKLAPTRLVGLMMGMWFMSNAFAGVLSGVIAKMTTGEGNFEDTFLFIVKFSAAAAVLLLLLTPLLKRLIRKPDRKVEAEV